MEDDIEVMRDPQLLSEIIDRIDVDWDILFTDRDMRDAEGRHKVCYLASKRPDFVAHSNDFALKKSINSDVYQIGARWGAHSMILRRSGIEKLLQFFLAHQVFFPYDMDYILPRGLKMYTVLQDIVSNQPGAPSDNGGPNYKNEKP